MIRFLNCALIETVESEKVFIFHIYEMSYRTIWLNSINSSMGLKFRGYSLRLVFEIQHFPVNLDENISLHIKQFLLYSLKWQLTNGIENYK